MSPSTRKIDAKFLVFEKNKIANYPSLVFAAEHQKIAICMVFTKSACGLPPLSTLPSAPEEHGRINPKAMSMFLALN